MVDRKGIEANQFNDFLMALLGMGSRGFRSGREAFCDEVAPRSKFPMSRYEKSCIRLGR